MDTHTHTRVYPLSRNPPLRTYTHTHSHTHIDTRRHTHTYTHTHTHIHKQTLHTYTLTHRHIHTLIHVHTHAHTHTHTHAHTIRVGAAVLSAKGNIYSVRCGVYLCLRVQCIPIHHSPGLQCGECRIPPVLLCRADRNPHGRLRGQSTVCCILSALCSLLSAVRCLLYNRAEQTVINTAVAQVACMPHLPTPLMETANSIGLHECNLLDKLKLALTTILLPSRP